MKKVLVMLTALLAVLMVFSVPAAAQPAVSVEEAVPVPIQALGIKAPPVAETGEKVLVTVFNRLTGSPVARAGVWAVDFRSSPVTVASAADAEEHGIFLGWTNASGQVVHIFDSQGWYLLVAVKDGFMPGFAWTYIKPASRALAIKAPVSAPAGEKVTMTVYERNSGTVVAGAGVWAYATGDDAAVAAESEEAARSIIQYGIFLGTTDNQGQVHHAFDKTGRDILLAVKDGYTPGFGKIAITEQKALAIRNPAQVKINEKVPVRVVEKTVLTVEIPVPKAGVWALNISNAVDIAESADTAVQAQKRGIFLGWTNGEGYVDPYPVFRAPGRYLLVALKDGYAAGFSRISVFPLLIPTPKPVPEATSANPVNLFSSILKRLTARNVTTANAAGIEAKSIIEADLN